MGPGHNLRRDKRRRDETGDTTETAGKRTRRTPHKPGHNHSLLNALTQDRSTQTRRHTRHPVHDRAGGGPGGADVLPPIPLVSGAISHCKSSGDSGTRTKLKKSDMVNLARSSKKLSWCGARTCHRALVTILTPRLRR